MPNLLDIYDGWNLNSWGGFSLMGIPKVCSGYQQSLTRWIPPHWGCRGSLDRQDTICCVCPRQDSQSQVWGRERRENPAPPHCRRRRHHHHHYYLMPTQPTSLSVCKGTGRVSCQRTGMLMCEPVGRGWVNCGKNLPSDVPNMASHMAERENRNVTGKKRERRNIDKTTLPQGGTPNRYRSCILKSQTLVCCSCYSHHAWFRAHICKLDK